MTSNKIVTDADRWVVYLSSILIRGIQTVGHLSTRSPLDVSVANIYSMWCFSLGLVTLSGTTTYAVITVSSSGYHLQYSFYLAVVAMVFSFISTTASAVAVSKVKLIPEKTNSKVAEESVTDVTILTWRVSSTVGLQNPIAFRFERTQDFWGECVPEPQIRAIAPHSCVNDIAESAYSSEDAARNTVSHYIKSKSDDNMF